MSTQDRFATATAGSIKTRSDWMPATGVRPFIFDDPVLVWLPFHGEAHGFKPDQSPYEFLDFIAEKGRTFEGKWVGEIAPDAPRVCKEAFEVRAVQAVERTAQLIEAGVPVIVQPALWWAPEAIYGVPDLLVHSEWLATKYPDVFPRPKVPHYRVLDIKFTTKLEEAQKARQLRNYAAQLRLYSYMLGQLQGVMPEYGLIVTRDHIFSPLRVDVTSVLDERLDPDLSALRDRFIDIKVNGAKYLPWRDKIVESNLSNDEDAPWRSAKLIIAQEKLPGRDPGLVYQVGANAKAQLAALGFSSLDSMIQADPSTVPLERCKGLGAARSRQIRTILQANRTGTPVIPARAMVLEKKLIELYVDFEYLTNVNVDFDRQWPDCEGCEMIFMIGVGWEEASTWRFESFTAAAENQRQELEMFESFLRFLKTRGGRALNSADLALYHWSSAETWQARRASDRHSLPADHTLRNLPWVDLQRAFLEVPCAVPGAWTYELKQIARALARLDAQLDPEWPGDLDEGLRAMVMGWRGYQGGDFLGSQERATVTRYLEADCKALWKILSWLRSCA